MNADIFISYRRDDCHALAIAVRERLCREFHEKQVFFDEAGILAGDDFIKAIRSLIRRCRVALALIGPGWLSACNSDGSQRIFLDGDIVRMELRNALDTTTVQVIPILVSGASMPTETALPHDLRQLHRRAALPLRPESFTTDMRLIVGRIQELLYGRSRLGRLGWIRSIFSLARKRSDGSPQEDISSFFLSRQQLALTKVSELDSLNVDPIVEAEVYLTYNRPNTAAEVLRDAMRADPRRVDIRMKLLEICSKQGDTKAFELVALQIHALTGGQGDDWKKVSLLGQRIDPENPHYRPNGQTEGAGSTDGRSARVPLRRMDVNLGAPPPTSTPTPLEAPKQPEEAANSIDFDLDSIAFDEPAPTRMPLASSGRSQSGSVDFGTFMISTPDDAPARPSATHGADPALDEDGDPLSRKLELAEEFRQIGDIEGARDLLEEVAAKADGELRRIAQVMLGTLS